MYVKTMKGKSKEHNVFTTREHENIASYYNTRTTETVAEHVGGNITSFSFLKKKPIIITKTGHCVS